MGGTGPIDTPMQLSRRPNVATSATIRGVGAVLLLHPRVDKMATTSPSGRRLPTLRRVLKWLGVICVGLAALAVALVAWLQAPAGRRLVLSRVTQLLAAQQIDFRADQLRYNLLDLSLDLRNVTIRSPRRAQDPPFAVIAHLSADLSLVDLIRGRYVVEAADIDGLSLQYLIDADGDNLPRPPSDPNEPSEPLDYLIARMSVTHAQVRYDNRVQEIAATVHLSSISVKGDRLTDRHAVSLSSRDGHLHATGRDVRLDSLSADLDLGKDDVRVAHATMDAAGARVEVSGTLARFDDPRLDARVLAVIDVARVARLAGPMDPAAGQRDRRRSCQRSGCRARTGRAHPRARAGVSYAGPDLARRACRITTPLVVK